MPDTIRSLNIKTTRHVLTEHRGGVKVGTFGEECQCGWEGHRWVDHVAPLLVDALVGASSA